MVNAENTSASNHDIADFYDAFSKRLLRDYVHGNARVDAAIERVCTAIKPSQTQVLDVGCGIGVTSHRYKLQCPWVSVHGIDISPNNISIARRLFEQQEVRYSVSAMESPPEDQTYDVIALIDVYEHIPRGAWPQFNQVLANSLSPNGLLVLTTPSSLHQNYLAEHNPAGLQIVDETVELPDMLELAAVLQGKITCFKTIAVWYSNDYLHVVIDRNPEFRGVSKGTKSNAPLIQRLRSLIINERKAEIRRRKAQVKRVLGVNVE